MTAVYKAARNGGGTMKSAVLTGIRQIAIRELEKPKPQKGEVLISVKACGICGTDVHIFEGDKGAADNPLPIVLGHEFSGVVETIGAAVTNVEVGERICVDPNVMCGECYYCKSGSGHFCEHMTGIGTTVNGGFAEYCVVPAKQLYKLADTTTFTEGAMAEPLACCLHGIDLCEICPGDDVVIIGGGTIGMLMLQLAHISGAARIILVEPVQTKCETGKKLGADICIDPTCEDVQTALKDAGVHHVSCVIECVGKLRTLQQAIEIAGKNSIVMMFGLTKPDDMLPIRPYDIFRKEIVLKASFINPYTMARAVTLINQRHIDVNRIQAGVITPEALGEILDDPEKRSRGKIIVEF